MIEDTVRRLARDELEKALVEYLERLRALEMTVAHLTQRLIDIQVNRR